MLKVKICGIRRTEDVTFINKHLPEYAGFIFAPSKRQVTIDHASALMEVLDRRVKRVGVFVNEEIQQIVNTVRQCNLDVIQLHGDESSGFVEQLKVALAASGINCNSVETALNPKGKIEIWKAVRVKDEESIRHLENYRVDAYLLDAYVDGSYGGAGKTFDWELAIKAKGFGKIVLAGGLNVDNVQQAIRCVYPFAVDVSSGVERDGSKDEEKIRDFICRVRNYE